MKAHCLVFSALLASAFAQTPSAGDVAATAERAIERAHLRASATDVAAAVTPLEAALATDAKNPALLYEAAFAHYARGSSLRTPDKKEALGAELEKAAGLLERVKGQPWEAEAAAFRASIYGQLIGVKGGMSAMSLGPKSGQLLTRAAKELPASPRVLLFRGISLFNTPPMFGGDPAEAAKLLQQSVDAFAAEAKTPAASAGPRWGHADALTWLGLVKQKAGDAAGARAAWEEALAIEPDYGWVKYGLLPSLQQKGKTGAVAAPKAELVAAFFPAEGTPRKTGILMLGGSEGGLPGQARAALFTKAGYSVLTVAYFKAAGLPEALELIPLEYFDAAFARLRHDAGPAMEKIVVVGGSKGAELALLLASRKSEIAGVIATAPSSAVWQGIPKDFSAPAQSSWSAGGKPLVFLPYDGSAGFDPSVPRAIYKLYEHSLRNTDAVARAQIPVEKIRGPILLLTGREDALWPSSVMAEAIGARLKAKGFAFGFEHVSYADAGHTLSEYYIVGGSPEGNRQARLEASAKALQFLDAIERGLAVKVAAQ